MTKKKIKPKKKKKKKKRSRVYFGIDVQDAIVKYNQSENPIERNEIYKEDIHYAFDKLAENIINTFKFSYFDYGFRDIKDEVVSFLVVNMHKYDHTKGSKAFSYFSVVAKNYLILNNNNNYKKKKLHKHIDNVNPKSFSYVMEDNGIQDMFDQISKYFDKKIPTMFKRKRDIDIAYAIVELMYRIEEIENFNKKGLYLLIREMTGVNTSHITKIVNEMKKHYKRLIREFYANGHILDDKHKKHKKNIFF